MENEKNKINFYRRQRESRKINHHSAHTMGRMESLNAMTHGCTRVQWTFVEIEKNLTFKWLALPEKKIASFARLARAVTKLWRVKNEETAHQNVMENILQFSFMKLARERVAARRHVEFNQRWKRDVCVFHTVRIK